MAFPYKKFSNIAKLGSGADDEVFSATITTAPYKVVIKKLATDLSEFHTSYKMFDRNVKTLKSLHHNNIIRVFDYGVYENSYFMSMEYIDGYDLEQLLHLPSFNRSIGLMIIFQALSGLVYAHKHGVSHCDIKPGNILVSRSGRAKLSDFGLAHVKEHLLRAGTSTGSVFTTPFYMPPEQASAIADGALDSDVWAETTTLAYKETPEQHAKTLKDQTLDWDIWSVGVLLYRICSGRLPFNGKNLSQLANAIATQEPTPIHSLAPSMPTDLCNAIESCLAKDPQKRLASIDPIIASLQLFILSTGVHDIESAIKKHISDCTLQNGAAVEPDLPETDTNIPVQSPLSFFPFQPFLSKYRKTAGIVLALLVIFILGAVFIPHGRNNASNKAATVSKSRPVAAQPAVSAETHTATPGATHASAPITAGPSSIPSATEESSIIDAAIAKMAAAESAQKSAHAKAAPIQAPQKKPIHAAQKTAPETQKKKSNELVQETIKATENQLGVLKITVDPSIAVIVIDGGQITNQDLEKGIQFPTGSHAISITADGHVPYQQVLQIEPSTTQVMSIALKQQERGNGFLQIYTVPWSNIYVDGMMFGTTPTLTPISLKEGDHVLILQRDGFLPFTQTITIKSEAMTRIQTDLAREDSTANE